MASSEIGTIFLDRSLRVKMFTPPTRSFINLLPSDLGRPLTDITTHFAYEGLTSDCEFVLTSLQTVEREIKSAENRGICCAFCRIARRKTKSAASC